MDQDPQDRDYHRPVMVDEVLSILGPSLPGVFVDATLGGAGHSRRIIEEYAGEVRVIGIDRDPEALAEAARHGIEGIEGNFAELARLLEPLLVERPSAILFDFGVSSHQLDQPGRGFSYTSAGLLDMRMGPDAARTADEIVNRWDQGEIEAVLRRFGEEPLARRVAAAIVSARPVADTRHLADVVAAAMPPARRRGGHPARRTFQALRIAVNSELEAIESGIDQAIEILAGGGRLAAISYHSLEDRIVKRRFAAGSRGCTCPPGMPVCGCGSTSELRLLTRRAMRPTPEEVASNRRARSASMRAAEKLAA